MVKKKAGPKGPSKYTDEFIDNLAVKLDEWIAEPANFWIGKFASDNGLWMQRITEFADKNERLSDSLKKAKQIQQDRLVLLSLARKIDTTMAIFALKNVAGWRDMVPPAGDNNVFVNILNNFNSPEKILEATALLENRMRNASSS